ncbi:Pyridoxal phosphate-containing protein YggS [Olavius sp. associated proteobacterium Delta 1]|nr:Pyridoxal phosphate-containing protein YggS [Olavius sp. associated proteobacterium Delta 1]
MKDRLERVLERIQKAADHCNRSVDLIHLIAVSKTMPAEVVKEAIAAGVTDLAENYIQEAREKVNTLATFNVNWHYIGHLQSNKAKYAVRLFDLIHSVDSLKLAKELNKYAQKNDKIQSILVQVNVAKEESKSGVYAENTIELLKNIGQLDNVSVKGLMTMPPYFNAPERVRPFFAALRKLRDQIKAEGIPNIAMEELSMGMTGDFEAAIEEGATMVRIGTAIFGERF